jgi:hypothetical protein
MMRTFLEKEDSMKKLVILLVVSALFVFSNSLQIQANEYITYQEIVFESSTGKLIREYSDKQMKEYFQRYQKSKWVGWHVAVLNKNELVEFIADTKLKIYNNGYSTFKHNIAFSSKEETKFQISATGDIGVDVKGEVKKFKGSVDVSIKTTIQYTKTTTVSESYDFVIIVDPGTYVTIRSRGEGYINNGVAMNYFFWIMTQKGTWETFIMTTEYYEIIKERIK